MTNLNCVSLLSSWDDSCGSKPRLFFPLVLYVYEYLAQLVLVYFLLL